MQLKIVERHDPRFQLAHHIIVPRTLPKHVQRLPDERSKRGDDDINTGTEAAIGAEDQDEDEEEDGTEYQPSDEDHTPDHDEEDNDSQEEEDDKEVDEEDDYPQRQTRRALPCLTRPRRPTRSRLFRGSMIAAKDNAQLVSTGRSTEAPLTRRAHGLKLPPQMRLCTERRCARISNSTSRSQHR